MSGAPAPDEAKRQWAVLLRLQDDVAAVRRFLEGGIDPSGQHHEGLITQHDRLRRDFCRHVDEHQAGGGRWWALWLVLIGAIAGRLPDLILWASRASALTGGKP